MQNRKLNFLQRGHLNLLLAATIAGCSFEFFHYLIRLIPQGQYLEYIKLGSTAIFITFIIAFIAWNILKTSLKFNLVKAVKLDKVIEFSKALDTLCKEKLNWQIKYIQNKKVNIYICENPLLRDESDIKVTKWVTFFDIKGIMALNGNKQLCLDYEDYERLLKEKYEFEDFKISEEVTSLKAKLKDCEELSSKLQKENTKMFEELEEVKKKNQTSKAREEKENKQKQAKLPFYFLAYSTLKALKDRATAETKYTRPEIQKAFEEELDKNKDLKKDISALLQDCRLKKSINPYDLTGWAMEYLRDSLGDMVKK